MLTLEPLRKSDAVRLRSYRNEIKRYCREFRDISEYHQERWFDEYCEQAYNPNPKTLLWGLWDAYDGLVAVGGWTYINWHTRRAELTYYTLPEFRGKGYGRLTLNMLINKAFNDLALRTVYGEVHAFNEASLKCMQACGFTIAGEYTDAAIDTDNGQYCNVILLELVNDYIPNNGRDGNDRERNSVPLAGCNSQDT